MVQAFILQNSYPCHQGGTKMSWIPLINVKFVIHDHTKQQENCHVFPPPLKRLY
jgi:hypothetical protein